MVKRNAHFQNSVRLPKSGHQKRSREARTKYVSSQKAFSQNGKVIGGQGKLHRGSPLQAVCRSRFEWAVLAASGRLASLSKRLVDRRSGSGKLYRAAY